LQVFTETTEYAGEDVYYFPHSGNLAATMPGGGLTSLEQERDLTPKHPRNDMHRSPILPDSDSPQAADANAADDSPPERLDLAQGAASDQSPEMLSKWDRACPLCERILPHHKLFPHFASNPDVNYAAAIHVIKAYHPDWFEDSGLCQHCWESFIKTSRIIQSLKFRRPAHARPIAASATKVSRMR
jgi:hypothetical protein